MLRNKRGWIVLAALAGIVFLQSFPLLITLAIVGLSGWAYPAAVRPLKNGKFWIVIGLLVIIVPLFTGIQDRSLWGFTYSHAALVKTGFMALRGISIFMLFQVLTVELDSEVFARLLSRYGTFHTAILYRLSKQIIPEARQILNERIGRKPDRRLFHPRFFFQRIKLVFQDLIRLAEQLDQSSFSRLNLEPEALPNQISAPALIVVTGEPGTGKTTWLKALSDALKKHSLSVGGFLTMRQYVSESRWNLQLVSLATGDKREVATMTPRDTELKTEHYYFNPDVLHWGTEQLKLARENWIIIDEVGIFEFERQGFFPALQVLDTHYTGILVLTLRKSLYENFDHFLEENFSRIHTWQRYSIHLDQVNSARQTDGKQ